MDIDLNTAEVQDWLENFRHIEVDENEEFGAPVAGPERPTGVATHVPICARCPNSDKVLVLLNGVIQGGVLAAHAGKTDGWIVQSNLMDRSVWEEDTEDEYWDVKFFRGSVVLLESTIESAKALNEFFTGKTTPAISIGHTVVDS